jgi:hypothetical protein
MPDTRHQSMKIAMDETSFDRGGIEACNGSAAVIAESIPAAVKSELVISTAQTRLSKLNGASSAIQKLPREVTIRRIVSGSQRVPVRIDSDHGASQAFNLQGLRKAGLSVKPDVRVR